MFFNNQSEVKNENVLIHEHKFLANETQLNHLKRQVLA